jgi:phage repressor protein C with HTH and peptisase S24 domain
MSSPSDAAAKTTELPDPNMVAESDESMTPVDRLRQAWFARGYPSAEAFANAVGVRPGTLRQQLSRSGLPRDAAIRYATFLGVSLSWLLTGQHLRHKVPLSHGGTLSPDNVEPDGTLIAGRAGRVRAAGRTADGTMVSIDQLPAGGRHPNPDFFNAQIPPEQPPQIVGDRDLPVYGAAQGGDGMTVDPHPIEWVKRPAPLLSVNKGFAVYVVGDSMSPAYEQGDMVFVHPSLPLSRGDDALLVSQPESGGEWTAIVKRVTGWTDKAWKLQQFNPRKEYDTPRAQ